MDANTWEAWCYGCALRWTIDDEPEDYGRVRDAVLAHRDTQTDWGTLTDRVTADAIRPATADEWFASTHTHTDEGVIDVEGRSVYVQGGPDA